MNTGLKIIVLVTAVVASLSACAPSRDDLIADNAATVTRFCVDCHNDAEFTADLTLERLDLDTVGEHADVWEKVVRKLRAGMMPPPGDPRPESSQYASLISFLETELDDSFLPMLPPPGIHRLNRTEYANAIRDLLALDVDARQFLPADDSSRGFDNQAGTLNLSPALLEAYLSAAGKISRIAIGNVATPTQTLYRVAEDTTQNYHVEGLPFGTRGGILIDHHFPVDGTYNIKVFSVNLGNMGNFRPFGEVRGEQLDILLDGDRVELVDWDEALGVDGGFGGGRLRTIDVSVAAKAGPHKLGVTFLASNFAPGLDLNNAFERSTIETGGLPGFTFYPHVGSVRIDGPYDVSGVNQTPSRERIFVCAPASADQEPACAEQIIRTLARRAYRGFVTEQDVDTLLDFYAEGRQQGSFDAGIEMVVQRILVEPKFIYRIEEEPSDLEPGQTFTLSSLELASRLSFFLWSSIPDDTLLALAEADRLQDPQVLAQQVERMLNDPKSTAMTENFAGQWLALRNLDGHAPVVDQFPDFDDNLRQAFRRETELLFDSILREDRSVIDLLTADYTFVNERLAKHYGIPGVQGSMFRRVELGEEFAMRRGLIGKGSMLTVSSQPGRTSPVMRGKWIMSTILGVPAPDPPPDVPPLEAKVTDAAGNTRQPTLREQMESHRANPACRGCHMLMDPFGFALETYDATGRWRTVDNGNPIDASVEMYDGSPVDGVEEIRGLLLKYQDQYVLNVAEKLMIYAVGRGMEYYDMPVIRSIAREVADNGYKFRALIQAVVQSPQFRMSTAAATGGQQALLEPSVPFSPGARIASN